MEGLRAIHLKKGKKVHVQAFEQHYISNEQNRVIQRVPHVRFYIFEQASGSHCMDQHQIALNNQSIHLVFPNQVNLLKADYAKGFVLHLSSALFFTVFNNILCFYMNYQLKEEGKSFPITQIQFETIYQINTLLVQALNNNESELIVDHYLQLFLMKLANSYGNIDKLNSNNYPLENQFLELVKYNFKKIKSVAEYANLLQTTPKKLYFATQKTLFKSPTQIHTDCLLAEVYRLLILEKKILSRNCS